MKQISGEKSESLSGIIDSQKETISKMEGLIFFHTSCEAGDKSSCDILAEMLKMYHEPDAIDS